MTRAQAVTLAAACITTLSAGTNYVFSAYGPQLAAQLSLTSTKMNVVGTAGNLGVYLSGPLVGIAVDRKGPRVILMFAASCLFFGYTLIRYLYDNEISSMPGLVLGEFVTGIGSSAAVTAAGNGVAKSFEGKRRGSALGLVYSGFGLSAFLYSNISHASFLHGDNRTSSFLLVLAIGCGVSVFIGSLFVRPILVAHSPPSKGYRSLAVEEEDRGRASSVSPGLSPRHSLDHERTFEFDATHSDASDSSREDRGSKDEDAKENGVDISGLRLLRTSEFWIFFAITGLCSGTGLLVINNLGTIAKTLSHTEKEPHDVLKSQAYLVSLLSVFNCLGRLLAGFVSDYFLHHSPLRWRLDRVWFLVPMSCLFIVSQIMFGRVEQVDGWAGMAGPTALLGLGYGALFGLLPTLILDWFGIANMAQNIGYATLAPAVFSNLTNVAFGLIYDSNVDTETLVPRGGATVEHLCLKGRQCYVSAFHATTSMCILSLVLSVWLARRLEAQKRV